MSILTACSSNSSDTNSSPTAFSTSVTTTANTVINGTLNAADAEGDALTFSIKTNGTLGIATITNSNTGEFTYTPNTNVIGDDSFTFIANDSSSDSNLAAVTVHINDLTRAENDSYSVDEGDIFSANALTGVLINDITNPGNMVTTILVTAPTLAANFTFNTDGSFNYTHNGSEIFFDSFTYKIKSESIISNKLMQTDSNTATVNLNINSVNDIPIASNNVYNITENGTLNVNSIIGVRANATDGDNETNSLSVSIVSSPSNAIAFTLSTDGSFTYTHDGSESPTDTFTYLVSDSSDNSNVASATISVSPVNDPPIANDNNYGVLENSTLVINTNAGVRTNTVDNDTITANLSVLIVGSPLRAQSFTLNADGSFTYVHDGSETTTDNFTYKINDGLSDSNIATAMITISPVNDTPIATVGLCNTTARENILNGMVTANDVDNAPNELMFSVVTNGTKGTAAITDPTTGAFTYTPNGVDWGTDTFTFKVSDPSNAEDTTSIRIEIDPKIMLLGDSITAGVLTGATPTNSNRKGFRKQLHDSLVSEGYSFDFVGSLSSGSAFTGADAFDIDHEGHPGYTDDEIAFGRIGELSPNGVYEWLGAVPAEFVLLHIGTNGFNTSAADVQDILNETDRYELDFARSVHVFLAKIIDWNPLNIDIPIFNTNVQNMAVARVGDNITLVDQYNALTYPNDMTDLVHPNDTGYSKMATTWLDSISPFLTKCP